MYTQSATVRGASNSLEQTHLATPQTNVSKNNYKGMIPMTLALFLEASLAILQQHVFVFVQFIVMSCLSRKWGGRGATHLYFHKYSPAFLFTKRLTLLMKTPEDEAGLFT